MKLTDTVIFNSRRAIINFCIFNIDWKMLKNSIWTFHLKYRWKSSVTYIYTCKRAHLPDESRNKCKVVPAAGLLTTLTRRKHRYDAFLSAERSDQKSEELLFRNLFSVMRGNVAKWNLVPGRGLSDAAAENFVARARAPPASYWNPQQRQPYFRIRHLASAQP